MIDGIELKCNYIVISFILCLTPLPLLVLKVNVIRKFALENKYCLIINKLFYRL